MHDAKPVRFLRFFRDHELPDAALAVLAGLAIALVVFMLVAAIVLKVSGGHAH